MTHRTREDVTTWTWQYIINWDETIEHERRRDHFYLTRRNHLKMRSLEHETMWTWDLLNMRPCEHETTWRWDHLNMRGRDHLNMRRRNHLNMRRRDHLNMSHIHKLLKTWTVFNDVPYDTIDSCRIVALMIFRFVALKITNHT